MKNWSIPEKTNAAMMSFLVSHYGSRGKVEYALKNSALMNGLLEKQAIVPLFVKATLGVIDFRAGIELMKSPDGEDYEVTGER